MIDTNKQNTLFMDLLFLLHALFPKQLNKSAWHKCTSSSVKYGNITAVTHGPSQTVFCDKCWHLRHIIYPCVPIFTCSYFGLCAVYNIQPRIKLIYPTTNIPVLFIKMEASFGTTGNRMRKSWIAKEMFCSTASYFHISSSVVLLISIISTPPGIIYMTYMQHICLQYSLQIYRGDLPFIADDKLSINSNDHLNPASVW